MKTKIQFIVSTGKVCALGVIVNNKARIKKGHLKGMKIYIIRSIKIEIP